MSGAALIGTVPSHWSLKPLRLIGRLLKGTGGSKVDIVDDGVPCVRYGELYTTHNNFIERARTYLTEERAQDYTPIEYGDVLFAASGETLEEIGKSAVNLLHGARCGGDVVILRPSEPTVARFLGYATDAAPVAGQKSLAGRGTTVKHVYPDELREVVVAIPPLKEQQAIADYLDRETARLDALVAAKERVLALLAEKRRALITRTVTRGLDPRAPLRDSGIPWLGEIPAHWGIKKLAFLASLKSGESITADDIRDEGPYAVYGGNGLRGYTDRFTHDGEYVLIGRQGALCGNINYSEGQFWPSEHAVVVTPRETLSVGWLGELLRVMDLNQYSASAAQPGLAVDTIAALRVPIPAFDEQHAIAAFLDRQTARLDSLSLSISETIALLKERRSALIAAAVTGQIDVGSAT